MKQGRVVVGGNDGHVGRTAIRTAVGGVPIGWPIAVRTAADVGLDTAAIGEDRGEAANSASAGTWAQTL